MNIELSVILPCYNESAHLASFTEKLVKSLESECMSFEIIMVNDGSEDSTLNVILEMVEKFPEVVSFIHQKENRGIGFSYKNAFKKSKGEYVTWIPSDGEIPVESVTESFQQRASRKAVLSYPQIGMSNRGMLRRMLSKVFILTLNKVLDMDLKYYNGNALYRKKDILDLSVKSDRFGFNAELLILAIKDKKIEVVEVPFKLEKRHSGKSSALTFSVLADVLSMLFRTLFLSRKNR